MVNVGICLKFVVEEPASITVCSLHIKILRSMHNLNHNLRNLVNFE